MRAYNQKKAYLLITIIPNDEIKTNCINFPVVFC